MKKVINLYRANPVAFIVAVCVIILVIYFAVRAIRKGNENRASDSGLSGNTPAGRAAMYAQRFRLAFNPTGNAWVMGIDGTDEQALYDIAGQITRSELAEIGRSYRTQFSDDLAQRLISELDGSEYQKFNSIIDANSGL